jgi:hypothetical protein
MKAFAICIWRHSPVTELLQKFVREDSRVAHDSTAACAKLHVSSSTLGDQDGLS